MLSRITSRLVDGMRRPIDIAWLAAFRIMFGLAMCVSMARFIGFNWIDPYFVQPAFHFKYYGFAWVQPLPGPLMHVAFWVLAVLAACMTVGLFFRFAAWAFTLGFVYVQLIDVTLYFQGIVAGPGGFELTNRDAITFE